MPRRLPLVLMLFALAGQAVADNLSQAYEAILKGDYLAGRAALERIADNAADPQVNRTLSWLDRYGEVRGSRETLRGTTYGWHAQQARDALAADKLYLALTFAAQAVAYTEDTDSFLQEDWVRTLRSRALDRAASYVEEEKWSKAHRFYAMLQRVDEKDKEIERLREQAARHARLGIIYKDQETVDRRTENVTYDLLENSLRLVSDNYFSEPDFSKMVIGGLDNLVALCNTKKLYTGPKSSPAFDGVANPVAREHFLGKIEELRRQATTQRRFGYKDVLRTFETLRGISRESVNLPQELLIIEFLEGCLAELDDFTSIVWPADAEDFDKMMIGEFRGVGIQLGLDEFTERLKVVTPLENSPALRAGIQPGDLIIKVDGETTAGWTTDKAVREITGKEGSQVVLTIFRPETGDEIDYPLERSRIQLTTVRGVERIGGTDQWDYMLDREAGIAYARLTGFNPESHEELRIALRDARKQGMRGLVLDLRGNPGGLLDVAVDTVSMFVEKGDVVSTRGRVENRQRLRVRGEAEFSDLPLVVLVNEGSASASEILAGALQDHERAIVFGDRTFGKGSVQRVLALDRGFNLRRRARGARLKLTTALYYLPSGRSPHKASPDAEIWGVDPDLQIRLTPKEFGKVLEHGQKAFVIHNEDKSASHLDEETIQKRLAELKAEVLAEESDEDEDERLLTDDDLTALQGDPHEAADFDPQLERALLHLRIKLQGGIPWPQMAKKTDADVQD